MRKWNIYSIAVILTFLIANKAIAQSLSLLKTTYLAHYPSASGVAFSEGKLYIIGDDAQKLLVLDADHNQIDSVTFYPHQQKRIPYQIKHDLESLSILSYKKNVYLVAVPSYSTEQRNKLYAFPLKDISQYKMMINATPIQHIKGLGIVEPNLEGSTKINNSILFSNRANKSQPSNYLITIPLKKNVLKRTKKWSKSTMVLSDAKDTLGLSGLDYWSNTDYLFFTASTEATSSATQDGEIGESYLGYISDYSKQARSATLKPSKLINLSKELHIGNQKIEGVSIESNDGKTMIFHLVADNDDGQSIVYKVQLTF
jgi:hypothetical protein